MKVASEIIKPISTLIASLAITAAVIFATLNWQVVTSTAQRNQAVDACLTNAQNSWQTTTSENGKSVTNTTTEPNREWYEECLKVKSIQK